jgi:hypothetical protein
MEYKVNVIESPSSNQNKNQNGNQNGVRPTPVQIKTSPPRSPKTVSTSPLSSLGSPGSPSPQLIQMFREEDVMAVRIYLGGWIQIGKKKKRKRWKFVTSHKYELSSVSPGTTLSQLIPIIAPLISSTGRSDAQGRGPGICLTPQQSDVLDTETGAKQMIRLCLTTRMDDTTEVVIKTTSDEIPYHYISLVPRDDDRFLRDLMRPTNTSEIALLCFLDIDNTSPNVTEPSGTTSKGSACGCW